MPPSEFTRFPELPAELRIQIWQAALAAPSVWAAAPTPNAGSLTGRARGHAFTMDFVGPAPYQAGLACKEAWDLMKRAYDRPIRGPAGEPHLTRLSWVDVNHTVVHVGDSDSPALPALGPDSWFRVKHVCVTWRLSHYYLISATCLRLSEMCPLLRTLIIQTRENDDEEAPPLTAERAACYASILEYTGPPLEYDGMDMAMFRTMLQYDLPKTRITVHVLGPGGLPSISS